MSASISTRDTYAISQSAGMQLQPATINWASEASPALSHATLCISCDASDEATRLGPLGSDSAAHSHGG